MGVCIGPPLTWVEQVGRVLFCVLRTDTSGIRTLSGVLLRSKVVVKKYIGKLVSIFSKVELIQVQQKREDGKFDNFVEVPGRI